MLNAQRLVFLSCFALFLSGCVSGYKQPYYACYFGDRLQEKCLQTEVDESEELVCVDVAKNTRFELRQCDEEVVEKKYSFF